jgi:hypothetical protein
MARDLEVRLEAHRIASERRAAGLPVWAKVIRLGDVWRDEALSYEQRRDVIVERLNASGWPAEDYLVEQLVFDISETVDAEEFDDCWGELLDRADLARVWIDTMSQ